MNKMITIGAITLFLAGLGASASIDTDTAIGRNNTQTKPALKLMVDGQAVLPALSPFYSGDILYVPARVLTEYYTSNLKWDNTAKTLTLQNGSSNYVLKPNQEYMLIDEHQYTLGGPAILRKGHVYIPADSLHSLSGAQATLNSSQTAVIVTSGSVSTSVRTLSEPLAVAADNPKVKLYTTLKDGDTYKGFILEVNGEQHEFNWEAPRLLNYPPQLYYADIDNDGLEEAIIILKIGTGTGISMEELHVIKPKQWEEVDITPADKAAAALFSSTITQDKGDALIKLEVKGATPSTVIFRYPDRAEEGFIGPQADVGAITNYTVEAGQLKAETNVFIGFMESIATLTLVYEPGDKGMEPKSIHMELHEEYASYIESKEL